MADYKLLVPKILRWEGGFSDNPYDAGGATMRGVTLATFRQFYGANMTVADLKAITDKQWRHIFKKGYWDKVRADEFVNQSIAELFVDWVWMSGATTPVKTLQRLVGAQQDGLLGPKTLAMVNAYEPARLYGALKAARYAFYDEIVAKRPANRVFLKGWHNRLESYVY